MYALTCYLQFSLKSGMYFVDSNMCQFEMRHPATKELVWKCLRLMTNAPWLMGLGRRCTRNHKHTRLEGHWTTWSAAYPMAWCEEYARLLSQAPTFLRMLTTHHPVASTDTSYKHVSSVSMLRHWPEYPSYYLTGDLDAARQASVMIPPSVENRLAPLLEETSDTVTETGPGLPGASSSSSSGPRPGEVFAEEEPGDAIGSGAGMAEA